VAVIIRSAAHHRPPLTSAAARAAAVRKLPGHIKKHPKKSYPSLTVKLRSRTPICGVALQEKLTKGHRFMSRGNDKLPLGVAFSR
jgi:hypothetical protein